MLIQSIYAGLATVDLLISWTGVRVGRMTPSAVRPNLRPRE